MKVPFFKVGAYADPSEGETKRLGKILKKKDRIMTGTGLGLAAGATGAALRSNQLAKEIRSDLKVVNNRRSVGAGLGAVIGGNTSLIRNEPPLHGLMGGGIAGAFVGDLASTKRLAGIKKMIAARGQLNTIAPVLGLGALATIGLKSNSQ